jgi:hypothetical protein
MEDFQELITTYKSVFNSRKLGDLPKNAEEAKEKHDLMKVKYASLLAIKNEKEIALVKGQLFVFHFAINYT